jgi:hypothetical protein
MMKPTKPSPKAAAGSSKALPPGSFSVPGSRAEAKLKGAPKPQRVEIGRDFVASHTGGAPLVLGKGKTLHVKGTPHTPR